MPITMVYVVGVGGGVGGFGVGLGVGFGVGFGVGEGVFAELELCFKSNDDELLDVELCVELDEARIELDEDIFFAELELCIAKYISSLSGKTMVSIPSATQL